MRELSWQDVTQQEYISQTGRIVQDTPDFWLIIDLEATCCDAGEFARHEMEIIEIGAILADGNSFQAVSEFQTFVRPVRNPILTDFCRDLTGINQSDVDAASEYPAVILRLREWMNEYANAVFCSWGDFDCRQFERDCELHNVDWPFRSPHVNLKKLYADQFSLGRGDGFGTVLKKHNMQFEGRPHRGIDDARNILRILPLILSR